jgi:hypothetical protein
MQLPPAAAAAAAAADNGRGHGGVHCTGGQTVRAGQRGGGGGGGGDCNDDDNDDDHDHDGRGFITCSQSSSTCLSLPRLSCVKASLLPLKRPRELACVSLTLSEIKREHGISPSSTTTTKTAHLATTIATTATVGAYHLLTIVHMLSLILSCLIHLLP